MLADEIEENHHWLFDYSQIQQDISRRILAYKDFDLSAWESAKASRYLCLSEYELTYVRILYNNVQEISYLVGQLEGYKPDDENTDPKVQHISSLIADDCMEHIDAKNDYSHQLINSLKRKLNFLNYYPTIWKWRKAKIK